MYWQVTKKDRKNKKGLAEVFACVTGQRAEEWTWTTSGTVNHLSRQSLVFRIFNYNLIYATFLLHLLF